ncbi:MAG: tetratricopeptide repeat protein [Acidobacteria bacterium]|nr:tetratricopeptide repeat protein [Acidobacteriota bacterium]
MLTLLLCGFALAGTEYDDAVALIEKGNPQAAVGLLEKVSRDQPKDARVWKALGVAYASMNQYANAEPAFAKACRLAPALADACYYHGRALYALNRFPDSLVALEKAPAGSCEVQLAKGQAHEALGNGAEAEAAFRQALRTCGWKTADAGAALGLFLLRQGRQGEAEPVLRATVSTFPNAGAARVHLGRLLLEKNDGEGAREQLEAAVRLTPNSGQAHVLLAKALVRLGRGAEAKAHFEAAARLEAAAQ